MWQRDAGGAARSGVSVPSATNSTVIAAWRDAIQINEWACETRATLRFPICRTQALLTERAEIALPVADPGVVKNAILPSLVAHPEDFVRGKGRRCGDWDGLARVDRNTFGASRCRETWKPAGRERSGISTGPAIDRRQ
jgi:hypothetical protein